MKSPPSLGLNMKHVQKKISEAFFLKTFSPDYIIATESANNSLEKSDYLQSFVDTKTKQEMPSADDILILDTGNACEGLIRIAITKENNTSIKSTKKIVNEGDVIISRLRPYLKQVAYIPKGAFELLNIKKLYCSTEFFVFSPKNSNMSIAWLVPWMLSENIQDLIQSAATGGHHPRFDISLLLKSRVPKNDNLNLISQEIETYCYEFIRLQENMRRLIGSF